MSIISKFFDAKQALCDYFGYNEDWVNIPFEDMGDDEWILTQRADGTGSVTHGPKLTFETLDAGDVIYSSSIYTQRFLDKWVYRGKEFTMIAMDTHTDGNKYLGIFRNDKEVKMTAKMKKAQYATNVWETLGKKA